MNPVLCLVLGEFEFIRRGTGHAKVLTGQINLVFQTIFFESRQFRCPDGKYRCEHVASEHVKLNVKLHQIVNCIGIHVRSRVEAENDIRDSLMRDVVYELVVLDEFASARLVAPDMQVAAVFLGSRIDKRPVHARCGRFV